MKLFDCHHCGQILYFENTHCEKCDYPLGFDPEKLDLLTLIPLDGELYADIDTNQTYRYCSNYQYQTCNWLIPAESNDTYCQACTHNRTIPNLSIDGNLALWRKVEVAKHRLFYSLLRLNLPFSKNQTPKDFQLAFDFLCGTEEDHILTGHSNGLITINVLEADRIVREKTKAAFGERYRTLIGHFRHEIGHYFWVLLVQKYPDRLAVFRQLFGDDQVDYQESLQAHYEDGYDHHWKGEYISHYATSHPWEDWAEVWAHYLHILDTMETAYSYGMQISPRVTQHIEDYFDVTVTNDPFHPNSNMDQIIDQWIPLSGAINSLNRSMGQPDIYPFFISPQTVEKINFVDQVVRPH